MSTIASKTLPTVAAPLTAPSFVPSFNRQDRKAIRKARLGAGARLAIGRCETGEQYLEAIVTRRVWSSPLPQPELAATMQRGLLGFVVSPGWSRTEYRVGLLGEALQLVRQMVDEYRQMVAEHP